MVAKVPSAVRQQPKTIHTIAIESEVPDLCNGGSSLICKFGCTFCKTLTCSGSIWQGLAVGFKGRASFRELCYASCQQVYWPGRHRKCCSKTFRSD